MSNTLLEIETLRNVKQHCSTCEHKTHARADDGTYRLLCTNSDEYISWSDTCSKWSENKNLK